MASPEIERIIEHVRLRSYELDHPWFSETSYNLTTNGSLLSFDMAKALKKAGLERITVSLDSLDDATFMRVNDVKFPVSKVLDAVDNAERAGLTRVKINMVVKGRENDHEILAMAERFSVSRFWDECRAAGATQIHFLGGILQMLLSRAPDPRDRDHGVRIAWGGGAPPDAWRAFEQRFGVELQRPL